MLRYAFGELGMRRIGLTHSRGNEASRRIAEKLGFSFEGIQRGANILPGGKSADRYCYARFDVAGLPNLDVKWQDDQFGVFGEATKQKLRAGHKPSWTTAIGSLRNAGEAPPLSNSCLSPS